ncbi:MAG: PKD domain-containing protein [Acidobacteriota bacterium]
MRSKLSSIGASLVLAIAAGDAWAVTGNVTPRSLSPLVTQGPTERLYAVTELQEALAKSAPYQAFLTRHGRGWEAQWDEILGTPVWVRGEGIPLIPAYRSASREQVEEVSRAFLRENRELFKVDPSDLALDSCTFYADTWVVYFHHEHRGLPVIRSSVELVFKLGRLVLFYGESYPVGDAEVAPLLTSDQARDVASGELGLPTSDTKSMPRDRSRLVIYPAITRAAIEYHLAWEITQERLDATPELSFLSYVDARTGKILEIQDRIENQFSGNVKAKVDDRTVGSPIVSANDTEERVIVGGSQTYTDVSGNWTVGGSGTQTLTLSLVGRHTSIANQAGGNLTISHPVTAGTPSNDVFNAGTEFELAQTDTYRAINATNLMVQGVYTGNAWLTSTVVTAKVNVNQTCNAYWDGANINMFRAGGQCNNTGRIFDVVAHEYGHGCDQNLPGGIADGGLSEFIGDQMAFLQTDDDRIGPGFFTAGGPIRDIDPSNFPCYDPNETEVHNQGEMLGSVVWDIHEALEAAGVTGTPLKNLLLTPIATSQTRSSWYNGMLVADDDDGNLNNGTPHGCIIWGQFNAHSCGQTRWPGVPTTQVPCTGGGGNPTADFMGNPTSGSSPLNVQFTDLSSGSPTQWAWDFGDGQGSYAQNPAHTYTTGGSFDVGLTIVNATGSAFKVKSKYINVNGGSGGDADIITGPGPGAIGPIVRTWDHEAPPAAVNSWAAYNAPYYGANVASVDIIGGGTRRSSRVRARELATARWSARGNRTASASQR